MNSGGSFHLSLRLRLGKGGAAQGTHSLDLFGFSYSTFSGSLAESGFQVDARADAFLHERRKMCVSIQYTHRST
jgi:hypothetical protein